MIRNRLEMLSLRSGSRLRPLQGTGLIVKLWQLYSRVFGEKPEDYRVQNLRASLLTLGFTQQPLKSLEALAAQDGDLEIRLAACRELASWNMRTRTPPDYAVALGWLKKAQSLASEKRQLIRFATAEIHCLHMLQKEKEAKERFSQHTEDGLWSPSMALAAANLYEDLLERIEVINSSLSYYKIPPLTLNASLGSLAYDQLSTKCPIEPRTNGPKVSVIVAAYEAEKTLPTALRSLQEQSWKNIEVIIIDDCSPSNKTINAARLFCETDPRFKILGMDQNRGAYVARNRALDEATGEYVTLHDADDWSHPTKIETQVEFMQRNPAIVACTSERARATSDLRFLRWTGQFHFITPNYSSLMFRRIEVQDKLGYWDTVRFGADSELIARMKRVFGVESVNNLRTGPLSFQRDSVTSITGNQAMGIDGFLFGARWEYADAQSFIHERQADLRYRQLDNSTNFPVPGIMLPDRTSNSSDNNNFDYIICADFRKSDLFVSEALDQVSKLKDKGFRVAVYMAYTYPSDMMEEMPMRMHFDSRRLLSELEVRVVCFGERVRCSMLLVYDANTLEYPQRYWPQIKTEGVKIVLRETDSIDESELRYSNTRQHCIKNFGAVPDYCALGDL